MAKALLRLLGTLAMTQAQMKDTRDALKFTRLCKYWSLNRCNLGADCNFAHTESELRDQPDLVSTQLCFQFARKGLCKNGESCRFAHGKSEIRRLPKNGKMERGGEPRKGPGSSVRGGEGQKAPSTAASLVASKATRPTPLPLTVDTATFRPPPGLEQEASLGSPGSPPPGLSSLAPEPTIFRAMLQAGLERACREPLLKQSSRDGLVADLPLSLDLSRISVKNNVDSGTESLSSTVYHSDASEPASPVGGPFWL